MQDAGNLARQSQQTQRLADVGAQPAKQYRQRIAAMCQDKADAIRAADAVARNDRGGACYTPRASCHSYELGAPATLPAQHQYPAWPSEPMPLDWHWHTRVGDLTRSFEFGNLDKQLLPISAQNASIYAAGLM